MIKLLNSKNVLFLIIGGFSLNLFLGSSYIIGVVVRDILILSNQNPLLTFISHEITQLFTFLFLVILGLKFLSKKEFSFKELRKLAVFVIVSYFLVQFIQVLYGVFVDFEGNNLELLENYVAYLSKNASLYIISSVLSYTLYIIFALVLFNYIKKDDL